MNAPARFFVGVVLVLAPALLGWFRSQTPNVPLRAPLDQLPTRLGAFEQLEIRPLDPQIEQVLGVDEYLLRLDTTRSGETVWLFVGYWARQRSGAQMHSPRNCLPGTGWEPISASQIDVEVMPDRPTIRINRYLVQKPGERRLVYYWYQRHDETVASELAARWMRVVGALVHNQSNGALVRVSTTLTGEPQQSDAVLMAYVRELYPRLMEILP